jgi:lipopolysaccharide/colanic/teichoic acid biosynthesis glycosyltransferase
VIGGVAPDTATTELTTGFDDDAEKVQVAPERRRGDQRAQTAPLRQRSPSTFGSPHGWELARRQRRTTALASPRPSRLSYPRLGKPVLDRVGAVIIGLAALPIATLIALVIRVTLGSPVLYVQERVGQHGRRFRMYKFRTMRMDRRRDQRPFPGPDRRVRHKTAADPRHTAVGMFLRQRSLDEIPQLWNVLLGQMSLVGPRPELPSVVAGYGPWQHERHLCRPGITGLWQVSARNNGDGTLMCEHTEVDLQYLRVLSLRTDLAILRKTFGVLGGGE